MGQNIFISIFLFFFFFWCAIWRKSLHPDFPPENVKLSDTRQVLSFKTATDTEEGGSLVFYKEKCYNEKIKINS